MNTEPVTEYLAEIETLVSQRDSQIAENLTDIERATKLRESGGITEENRKELLSLRLRTEFHADWLKKIDSEIERVGNLLLPCVAELRDQLRDSLQGVMSRRREKYRKHFVGTEGCSDRQFEAVWKDVSTRLDVKLPNLRKLKKAIAGVRAISANPLDPTPPVDRARFLLRMVEKCSSSPELLSK